MRDQVAESEASFDELKQRERMLRERLDSVRGRLADQYPEEQAAMMLVEMYGRLGSLSEGEPMAPVIVQIDRRLTRWVRQNLKRSGEDIGTFLNGVVLESYLMSEEP